MYRWTRRFPGDDKRLTIDGVTFVAANLTRDVGRRRWNLGELRGEGRVEWFDSASTFAEIEELIPNALNAVKSRG